VHQVGLSLHDYIEMHGQQNKKCTFKCYLLYKNTKHSSSGKRKTFCHKYKLNKLT